MTWTPLTVETPKVADSIHPQNIGATSIWLLTPEITHKDGRMPIVWETNHSQN